MAGALLLISLFLVTLIGGFLLRPEPIRSIRDFRSAGSVQERKQVTLRMAEFLKRNPKIIQQPTLTKLPLADARSVKAGDFQETFSIRFQGTDLRFRDSGEYDAWLHSTLQSGGDVLTQADYSNDPDLLLSTLKKCVEIDPSPDMKARVKSLLLERAESWMTGQDGSSMQLAQKALQQYLETEEDKELARKTVDHFLERTRAPQ